MRSCILALAVSSSLLSACGGLEPTPWFAEFCDARGLTYCDVRESECQRGIFEFLRCVSESPEQAIPETEFVSAEQNARPVSTGTSTGADANAGTHTSTDADANASMNASSDDDANSGSGSAGTQMEQRLRASLLHLGLRDSDADGSDDAASDSDGEPQRKFIHVSYDGQPANRISITNPGAAWDDPPVVRALAMGDVFALQDQRLGGLSAWLGRDPTSPDRWLAARALALGEAALYANILEAGLRRTSYWSTRASAVDWRPGWDSTGLEELATSSHPVEDAMNLLVERIGVAVVSETWREGQTNAVRALFRRPPEGTRFLLDDGELQRFWEGDWYWDVNDGSSVEWRMPGELPVELPEEFEGFEQVDSMAIGRWFTGLFLRVQGATNDHLMLRLDADRMFTFRSAATGREAFVWDTSWSFGFGASAASEFRAFVESTTWGKTKGVISDGSRVIVFGGDIDVDAWRASLSTELEVSDQAH